MTDGGAVAYGLARASDVSAADAEADLALRSVLDQLDIGGDLDRVAPTDESAPANGADRDSDASVDGSESGEQAPRSKPYFRSVYIPLPTRRFRFMSHWEISMVVRQSLQQLQTKNPMDDDFYYQVHTSRQGIPWKGVGFPGVEISGPQLQSKFRNADGSPILPDGTLGRIAVSSSRKPRPMLQMQGPSSAAISTKSIAVPAGSSAPKQFMFPELSLSFVVEEGIRCIMDLEDVDNLLIAFPSSDAQEHAQQFQLQQQRVSLGRRLLEHLGVNEMVDNNGPHLPHSLSLPLPDHTHIIFRYAIIAKGRNFVLRSLMCLHPDQSYFLLHVMLFKMFLFALPSDPTASDSKIAQVLTKLLDMWTPQQLTGLFCSFVSNPDNLSNLPLLARSPLGSVALLAFCKRGHQLRGDPRTPIPDVNLWLDLYFKLWFGLCERFELLLAPADDVPAAELADPDARWRLLADMISHTPPQLVDALRNNALIATLVEQALSIFPAAGYIRTVLTAAAHQEPSPNVHQ